MRACLIEIPLMHTVFDRPRSSYFLHTDRSTANTKDFASTASVMGVEWHLSEVLPALDTVEEQVQDGVQPLLIGLYKHSTVNLTAILP